GGTPTTYLGTRSDVIAVAATDSTDTVWPGWVRGPWVALSADGVRMASTMLERITPDSLGSRAPSYRAPMSGTSFAAPQVTGAVALLQARRRERGETPLTPAGALLRVRETA